MANLAQDDRASRTDTDTHAVVAAVGAPEDACVHIDEECDEPCLSGAIDTEETLLLLAAASSSNPSVASPRTAMRLSAGSETLGLLFMATSALSFSLMSVFVKAAGEWFTSSEIVLARSIVQCVGGIIGCGIARVSPWGPPGTRGLLASRGLAGALGLGFYFFTIVNMPLGDGTTLFFIGPALTAIAAHFMLGEPFTTLDAFATASCLIGVVLVSRPEAIFGPHPNNGGPETSYKYPRYIPATSAIIAAIILAVAYCLVRAVGRRVHFMVHVVYFGLTSTVFSSILVIAFSQGQTKPIRDWTSEQWVSMSLVGVFALIAQCFLNAGLQLANVGPGTLMRNLDIVFAFLFGQWLFGETPYTTSVIGALLIGLTTAGVAIIKWMYASPT